MKASMIAGIMFLVINLQSKAQLKGFSIGPYAELAKPVGNLDETHKNGIGVGLSADIRLGKWGLTGSAGYIHFTGKSITTGSGTKDIPDINAFPIRAGLKYRLAPIIYVKLESGVANFNKDNGSAVIVSPGIGLRILGLDIQGKYEAWVNNGTNSFWGLKVGYNF